MPLGVELGETIYCSSLQRCGERGEGQCATIFSYTSSDGVISCSKGEKVGDRWRVWGGGGRASQSSHPTTNPSREKTLTILYDTSVYSRLA
jgi:hypothetical protein